MVRSRGKQDEGGRHSSSKKIENDSASNDTSRVWNLVAKNYEVIQGAQISNSFILMLVLNEASEPLNSTQISEVIAEKSQGKIYKVSATLKDSLEHRLKREGYVTSIDIPQGGEKKPVKKSLYSITPKGKTLLNGWLGFIKAID
ncbi:MAG: PadR family transcriptional regulator [Thermoproteota archaeon]|nr:PadR family transcriptional regulator [Thermoproteota archaeon]